MCSGRVPSCIVLYSFFSLCKLITEGAGCEYSTLICHSPAEVGLDPQGGSNLRRKYID